MTHKKYFSIAFTIVYMLFSIAANAATNTGKDHSEPGTKNHAEKPMDHGQGKHSPVSHDEHSKAPHGKTHAPHSEELPHIHKFHKERVKKIKKHHGKFWLLTQVLLFICHAAILYICYLHAAH